MHIFNLFCKEVSLLKGVNSIIAMIESSSKGSQTIMSPEWINQEDSICLNAASTPWLWAAARLVFDPLDGGVKLVWGELDSVPYSALGRQASPFLKCLPRILFLLLLLSAFGFFLTLVMSSIINQIKSPGKFPPKINHFIIVVHDKRRKSKN